MMIITSELVHRKLQVPRSHISTVKIFSVYPKPPQELNPKKLYLKLIQLLPFAVVVLSLGFLLFNPIWISFIFCAKLRTHIWLELECQRKLLPRKGSQARERKERERIIQRYIPTYCIYCESF